MTFKCNNCGWTGDEPSVKGVEDKAHNAGAPLSDMCPICGDSIMTVEAPKIETPVVEETPIVEKVEEKKVEEKVDVSELDAKSKERVEDIVEDLKDDGKRNRSNKKPKSKRW